MHVQREGGERNGVFTRLVSCRSAGRPAAFLASTTNWWMRRRHSSIPMSCSHQVSAVMPQREAIQQQRLGGCYSRNMWYTLRRVNEPIKQHCTYPVVGGVTLAAGNDCAVGSHKNHAGVRGTAGRRKRGVSGLQFVVPDLYVLGRLS